MENICINILYVSCNDLKVLQKIVKELENLFECYFTMDIENHCYEIEFASDNSFPNKELEELTEGITDNTLYIQVISYNMKNEYVAHNIYKRGEWVKIL